MNFLYMGYVNQIFYHGINLSHVKMMKKKINNISHHLSILYLIKHE